MATKAELEAEVLRLRAELEQRDVAPREEKPEPEVAQEPREGDDESWDQSLADVLEVLEDLPQKQPIMLALGALAVGYLIGRAR